MLGFVVSWIVNVAVRELSLPHASVAVNVTVAEPVAPHKSLSAVKSFVHVTSLQASVATAPPYVSNQFWSSAALPAPSHSTVRLLGFVVMVGRVVSSTVKVAVVVLSFPHTSVAVNVTVAAPVAPHKSLNPT
jgi:hypothetical protein